MAPAESASEVSKDQPIEAVAVVPEHREPPPNHQATNGLMLWKSVKVINPKHPHFDQAGTVKLLDASTPEFVGVTFDSEDPDTVDLVHAADLERL